MTEVYRLVVKIEGELVYRVFKTLEREVQFRRGRLYVRRGEIIATASDVSSLRSLLHTVFRSIYLVKFVESLQE
ncbi:MAG: hypothetical protein ACK4SY_00965 [Pyrobaculum sp.]